jgi:hypothetical protein
MSQDTLSFVCNTPWLMDSTTGQSLSCWKDISAEVNNSKRDAEVIPMKEIMRIKWMITIECLYY